MVKPRENRVPMMLSNDELEAIDNWRFENRVATRSEAIRRLCQLGLVLHSRINLSSKIRYSTGQSFLAMGEALNIFDDEGKVVPGFPRNALEAAFEKFVNETAAIDNVLRELADQTDAITSPKNMGEVLATVGMTTEIYNRLLGRPSDKNGWTMNQLVGIEPPPEGKDD